MSDPSEESALLEASGSGEELFDAPTLFFLTHEETIRRWYGLSGNVRRVCRDYLMSLEPQLDALGSQRDMLLMSVDTSGGYHHHLLHHAETAMGLDRTPVVAFCLGWNLSSVRMSDHSYTPFIGIRTTLDAIGQRARSVLLAADNEAVRRLREKERLRGSGDRQWPVWEKIHSPHGWWTDLDGHRQGIIDRMAQLLDGFAPYVGQAAREISEQST